MVLYLGSSPIAGYSTNTKMNAHSLLDFKWSDHILNELSWVNADTFSWLSGDVYTSVYNKLVAEYDTGTTETETGVSYKKSDNGFKIADASQEQAVIDAYNSTGVAWFYILDTANRRFKLPRTKYNKYMSQVAVKGNGMTLGVTDGTNNVGMISRNVSNISVLSGFQSAYGVNVGDTTAHTTQLGYGITLGITTDASKSGMVADLSTDTNMLLYFYVGEFAQSALEQTAGYAQTLTEKKADVDLSNVNASGKSLASGWSMPSGRYIDLTLGASGATYTAPANGWIYSVPRFTTNGWFQINNSTSGSIRMSNIAQPSIWHYAICYVPCKKGDVLSVAYGGTIDSITFRFIYAEGESNV